MFDRRAKRDAVQKDKLARSLDGVSPIPREAKALAARQGELMVEEPEPEPQDREDRDREDLEDLEDLEESEAPAPWSQDPAAEETAGEGGTVARALSPRSSVVQAADAFLNEPDIVALEVLEEMLEDEAERRKEEEASAALQQERERAQLEEKAADFAVQVCI